jgi:short-subunit dehydrogenase
MSLPNDFTERYGPVALVTGASSGIGEQLAAALAERGLDLVLVARRRERLEALAARLSSEHGVKVEVAALDLAVRGDVEELLRRCEGRDIGLVVSNAGVGAKGRLHETGIDLLETVLDVNCRAPLLLAHAFAPRLIERGRGGLLFTGSIEAWTPSPWSVGYAASKAYLRSLGEGLWGELSQHGIDVLVLSPGATDTEILAQGGMRAEDMPTPVMAAEDVAREALERLPHGFNYIPGRVNRLLVRVLSALPRRMAVRAAGKGMRDALEKARRAAPPA